MNTKRKPRIAITEKYDKEKKKHYFEKRQHLLTLNKTEVGILKAALEYYLLVSDYAYTDWAMCGGCVGRSDYYYDNIVAGTKHTSGLLDVLNNLSSVKPEYAFWNDTQEVCRILKDELSRHKRKAQKFEDKFGALPFSIGTHSEKELEEIAKKHAEYKKNPEKYDKEWMEPAEDR